MGSFVHNPKKLGRYDIVKHLASGGMAEVLLARTSGIEGFARHVVLKRIRAEAAHDDRYVEMFLDEARLAATLHHHNIVQVTDIGEAEGEYFFTMEYVHGEDARSLLANLSNARKHLPLEHVLSIVCATAAGLHHAHEQRGPKGSLGIVHRDVSPANILIGFDGGVKVADFGIAKAAHRNTETRSGTLKGKVAYMSPEQCVCDTVDRRSDVFALGIVLYELLTVRRLFKGDNDFMTMTAIVLGYIPPPSTYRPNIPSELEEITLKALANKPEDRYQTADELRIALEQVASRLQLSLSATSLADYMKQQFGTRPEPWLDGVAVDDPDVGVDFDGSMSGVVQVPIEAAPAIETMRLAAASNKSATKPATVAAKPASSARARSPGAPRIVISDVEEATGSVIQLIPKPRADTQAATGEYAVVLGVAPTLPSPSADPHMLAGLFEPSPLDDDLPVASAELVPPLATARGSSGLQRDDLEKAGLHGLQIHEVDVVDLDDIDDAPAPPVQTPVRGRSNVRKLLGLIALVVVVGAIAIALWISRTGTQTPQPARAVVEPHRAAPAKQLAPTVAPTPVPESPPATPTPPAQKPATKAAVPAPKKPTTPPKKKWDPNSLFLE